MNTLAAFLSICFVLSPARAGAGDVQLPAFPKWAFCVSYQIRNADVREARPIDPNAERDPFNDGDTEIPLSVLGIRNIIDVAALSTRIVKSGILKHEEAESVIRDSTQGEELHPIIDSCNPRHIFVFYTYDGQPVAAIEVDFQYNRVRMRPEVRPSEGKRGPFETADLASLAKIAVEAGLDLKPFAETVEDYVERLKRLDKGAMKFPEELKRQDEPAKKEAEQVVPPNGP